MSIQAVPKWQSEIQRRRETLLSQLLTTATIGGFAALVLNYISLPAGSSMQERWAEMWPFLAVWLVILAVRLWRGLGYQWRAWASITLAYFLGFYTFVRGGLPGSGRVWMLLPPVLAFTFLGSKPGLWTGIVSALTYAFFAIALSYGLIPVPAEHVQTTLQEWGSAPANWGSEGASFWLIVAILVLFLRSFSQSWLEALRGVSAANEELEETNMQLHRQTSQLQTTTKIVQAGSSILEPDALQTAVVNQIQEGFELMGVYFVGLFLLEEASTTGEQFAVLKAATGEAGRLLLDMSHKVRVSEATTVGQCIAHQQARVVLDVGGTVKLGILPMPNTRSEIALPLHSRGRILGALNVHSTRESAFHEDDMAIMQTLADQVAVAIDNARLFSQTEAALEEVQAAHRRYLVEAWKDFLTMQPVNRVDYAQPGAEPADGGFLHKARRAAAVHGRTVATGNPPSDSDGETAPQTALVVPLKLRGQVIGTMALQETRRQRPWTAEEIVLAETVAEQVALTVENLRLMDETQRRAVRERLIGEITSRMRETLDIETVLQTAIREIGETLHIAEVEVRMGSGMAEGTA